MRDLFGISGSQQRYELIFNILLSLICKYNEIHKTLMNFAIARGQITTAMRRRVHKVNVNQKNVSQLRTWLKELTGRSDNPIKYTQVEGYVCQFNIQQNIYHMTPEGYIKRDDADIED